MRQCFSETPERFYTRWINLHRRLGTPNFDKNNLYIYIFVRKLNRDIQTQMDGIYWGFLKTGREAFQ